MAWGEDYSGGDGIASVLADTTPQLGGDLDVNGHSIVSVSDGDIVIQPNGTGQLTINDGAAPTKQLNFDLTAATAGVATSLRFVHTGNRTITFPNGSDFLVGRAESCTLTNKTLTTPTIGDLTNANHTHAAAGATGGTIAHTALTDKGTTSHADIDTHVANNPLNNLGAAVNPDADDDVDGGYAVGSVWLNTTQGRAFVCLDASDGAAVWVELGHTHTVPIRIDNPTAADTMFITHNEGPIIVLAAAGQVTTGTSLTWQVTWEDHNAFAPGTDIFTADMVSTTTWGSKTTADFVSSGAVAANKKLYFEAQSRSGTPARFEGWVKFVEVGIS